MKIALFYHSMYSDWNHSNAHFLRGITRELLKRGHIVSIYEPNDGWSMQNLLKHHGEVPLEEFHKYYPGQFSKFYDVKCIDLKQELADTDLVIVHEWNDPGLIFRIGENKGQSGYRLFFHDSHFRSVTDPGSISSLKLENYDGLLAYGEVIKDLYLENKWIKKGWIWHEAADTQIFRPYENTKKQGDLVWIGNWRDDQEADDLYEFIIQPVKELKLTAKIYGASFPIKAIRLLTEAGIEYGGWLPNYKVPEVFAQYRLTVHIPRRVFSEKLPGIPTIRPFEAMACGIPLISAPWKDSENLFNENHDYLMAHNKDQMIEQISRILDSKELSESLAENALRTINQKHTCKHRVEQLEQICQESGINTRASTIGYK